jgi:N-acetylglucosamine transport system substrate-binding protein
MEGENEMKKRFLRSIALLAIVSMIVSLFLTGCGGTKSEPAAESAANVESTQPAESEQASEPAETAGLKGDFEVQIFVGGYGDTWWKEMLEGFKKENPELNVIENMGPKVNEQMKTRWLSDNPPDFVYCDGDQGVNNAFAIDGKLMDLKDFFDNTKSADGKSIREHMIPGIISKINGGEYFAPYIFNAMALFYDDKLLKDNGIAVPQNFEEFLAAGEALKAKNIALLNYPGIYPTYLYQAFVQPALIAEGGQQLWEDTMAGKPGVFTSQPYKNVISKIATLAQKGYIQKGITALNHTQSQMEWLNGKAAFIANGLWVENEMKKDIPEGFVMQYNAAAIRSAGQKVSLVGSGVNNAIAATAKNKEAALAFMAYIYRDESVKRFIEIVGAPTCYKIDTSNVDIKSDMVKSCLNVLADPEVQIATSTSTAIPEVQKMWEDQLTSIVLGDMTVDQYCENLEKEAARVLASKK